MSNKKILVVVESPGKIKTIQKYLGNDYIVVATVGHCVDLASGGKAGIGIDIKNNFKPHYTILKDKIDVVDNIIKEAEKCSEIFLCSDADKEGEAISFHINNILKSTGKSCSRVIFREITEKAILEGIKNKGAINQDIFNAQEARRILDRLVGFLASPYLLRFYGANLSAGRVQSVATRLIIDRENDISSFKPEEYWNVGAQFSTENKELFVAKLENKITNKKDADSAVAKIKSLGDFYVVKVQAKKQKEYPQPPMITAKLQQYMSKKYGFEADRTMKAAQSLYEGGYISYHRTDSVRSSEESIKSVREWIKNAKLDLPKSQNEYATKSSAQDAHEAIRVTTIDLRPENTHFAPDEKLVYKTVWEFFVASQMNPAIYNTLSVKISSRSEPKIFFKVSGKALEYKGYLEIFGDAKESKIDLPNLKDGQVLSLTDKVKQEQKFTQPPARYNDATINEELEKRQIGRPATYAEIIKKITNRNYVEKQGSTFRATELGKKITDILVGSFSFLDYNYTAEMEKKLDDIEEGKLDKLTMLNDFFVPFQKALNDAYQKQGVDLCENCGFPKIDRVNKDGTKFSGCTNYQFCRKN